MAVYDRDLTFLANAEGLVNGGYPHHILLERLTNMLRDAYDDGWLDARAQQLAGLEIPECSQKWD